jgi:hypothetical protein
MPKRSVDAEKLGFFRFGNLGDGVIVTNDCGQWHHLDTAGFQALLDGKVDAEHADYDDLAAKGFIRDAMDLDALAESLRARKRFVGLGPCLHVIQLSDAAGPLSVETAKDIVDHLMLSTSRDLELRLIAGQAPVDADLLKFIVQYTTEKNRYEGKSIQYTLVSDLTGIDQATATWLVTKRFGVKTVLAGDAAAQDSLGKALGGAPHADVLAGIATLHSAADAKNRTGWRVQAEVPIGTTNIGDASALLASLTASGVGRIRIQPVFSGEHAVSVDAFRDFYQSLLTAMIEAGRTGDPLPEDHTVALLHRILRSEASNDVSIRSPSAQGTGQMVYDTSGRLFPSDHARRMFADDEDDMFLLGTAGITSYKDSVSHPTVRALALSSLVEAMPGFHNHWSAPFVGVDPIRSFARTGDLFTRVHDSPEHATQVAMIEALFGVLLAEDTESTGILEGLLD